MTAKHLKVQVLLARANATVAEGNMMTARYGQWNYDVTGCVQRLLDEADAIIKEIEAEENQPVDLTGVRNTGPR